MFQTDLELNCKSSIWFFCFVLTMFYTRKSSQFVIVFVCMTRKSRLETNGILMVHITEALNMNNAPHRENKALNILKKPEFRYNILKRFCNTTSLKVTDCFTFVCFWIWRVRRIYIFLISIMIIIIWKWALYPWAIKKRKTKV